MEQKTYVTQEFEPQCILRHFEDIAGIPHGTGHEQALGDHVLALAAKNGLQADRDEWGNILVQVPGTPGCEKASPLLIQGHMDMVLAKNDDVELDMVHEPIRLVLDGHILRADGTTLGADNAVGLCYMLRFMEPCDFPHPPFELLFTVEEEIGLVGAAKFDMSRIRSRRMINMDCGDPDVLVISATGDEVYDVRRECRTAPADGTALAARIYGLKGGHSSLEVGKNRGSAVELGGRMLSALCDEMPARLGELLVEGVGKNIPDNLTLKVSVPADRAARAREIMEQAYRTYASEYEEVDPGCRCDFTDTVLEQAACAEDTRAVADFLILVPYDVLHRDTEHPDWVLSSGLLTCVDYRDGLFTGRLPLRFNRDEFFAELQQQMKTIYRLTGVTAEKQPYGTPPWPALAHSDMKDACLQVYRDMFGEEMKYEVENGSVEPSIVVQKIPDMDCVGFAPKSRGAHTPKEHLYLDTVAPVWEYFKALLAVLSKS